MISLTEVYFPRPLSSTEQILSNSNLGLLSSKEFRELVIYIIPTIINKLPYNMNNYNDHEKLTTLEVLQPYLITKAKRGIIGKTPEAIKLRGQIKKASLDRGLVVILGEPGLEKDNIAALLHYNSINQQEPLILLDCSQLISDGRELFSQYFRRVLIDYLSTGTIILSNAEQISIELMLKIYDYITKQYPLIRIIIITEKRPLPLLNIKHFIYVHPLRDIRSDIPAYFDYFLKKFCKIIGIPKIKISAEVYHQLVQYDFPGNHRELQNLIEQTLIQVKYFVRHKNQKRFEKILLSKIKKAIDKSEEIKESIAQIRIKEVFSYNVYYDYITGLPNRILFLQQLNQILIKHPEQLIGILYMSLDRLKLIYENSCYDTCDLLVEKVVQLLQTNLYSQNILARINSDEFVILLTNFSNEIAIIQEAEIILDLLQSPITLDEYPELSFYLTASIGIVINQNNLISGERLLKNAAKAALQIKKTGGNNYKVYTPELNSNTNQLILESHLRQAIKNDELLLYYQPQIDIKSNKMIGVEALMRWNCKALGSIPPNKFIPLAEEVGLIDILGEWALETACYQAKLWQKLGYHPIHIGVNISARQFESIDLTKVIKQILNQTQLESRYLELEITESLALRDVHAISLILKDLTGIGVHVALDDFGTGYSSLSSLIDLHFDKIKIDQTFIRKLDEHKNATLVKGIVGLAHGFGVCVTAEGVETQEQYQFLSRVQCDCVQGYLFCPPVAVEELTGFFN